MKIIAFYLPAFHTTPENDNWWGKGFTEWNHLRNWKPRFPGHKIRKPKTYYNILHRETRLNQANLAKEYGLHGFCVYHYWFSGKKLLEKPYELMLEDGCPDLPFCFCWANENWTRSWSGGDDNILQEQTYSNDWEDHINYLSKFFNHKNYIRVNNKPLFVIYRINDIPDLVGRLEFYREKCDLHISQMKSHFDTSFNNLADCSIDFSPFHISKKSDGPEINYAGCYAGWDNSPRRIEIQDYQTHGCCTVAGFAEELKRSIVRAKGFGTDMIFINAWNEWGEQAILEPDTENEYSYLETLRKQIVTNNKSWELYHF